MRQTRVDFRGTCLVHPLFAPVPTGLAPKLPLSSTVIPLYSTAARFTVPRNSFVNYERAVMERLFYVKDGHGGHMLTPQPVAGSIDEKLSKFFCAFMSKNVSTSPMTAEQFLSTYTGSQRRRYEEARASLRVMGVERRDANVSHFIKAEGYNKADPCPRLISPRSPRYNYAVGKYIKALEPAVCNTVNRVFRSKTIFKGLNAQQQGSVLKEKWDRFADPIAIGLDANRFDQHVSVEALKWEHKVYCASVPRCHRKSLQSLLEWQLQNRIRAYYPDHTVKFTLPGGRMSGDMNTGLGNCLLMCAMVWSYADHVSVPIELANNGDDCVVFMERKHLDAFQDGLEEYFLELGFSMAVEAPVDKLEQVEFCQTKPIWTPDGYIMVRNPHVAISKDCLCVDGLGGRNHYRKWVNSVGQCGLSLTGGVPVFQEFYSGMIRASEGKTVQLDLSRQKSGFWWLSRNMTRKYGDIHPLTRVSFWEAFDITPEEQIAIESQYLKATPYYKRPTIDGVTSNFQFWDAF